MKNPFFSFFIICIILFFCFDFAVGMSISQKLEEKVSRLEKELKLLQQEQKAENRENARYVDAARLCMGRLTLETEVAVSSSDKNNQSNLYFTPYQGNVCTVYTGSVWLSKTFSELSLSLTGLSTDTNYDVFIYNNSGSLALEFSDPWTDDSTRDDGISIQNGVYVKTGVTSRRYLGTIRTVDDGGTAKGADTKTKRYVWNFGNRVRRNFLLDSESTYSWTCSSSWGSANGSSSNRFHFILGLPNESTLQVFILGGGYGSNAFSSQGVGINSTSTNVAQLYGYQSDSMSQSANPSLYSGVISTIGYNYLQWLEKADGGSCYGRSANYYQYGMIASLDM